MTIANLVWGAPAWVVPAAVLALLAVGLVVWSYGRAAASVWLRLAAAVLKIAAVVALAACLVEPLFSGVRPKPQANLFVILADNSRGLQIKDAGRRQTRGQQLKAELTRQAAWQTRLSQDFDLRSYVFDRRLRPVSDFSQLDFQGDQSAMTAALQTLGQRYHGRHTAGVLLLTDGNATDFRQGTVDYERLPPIYPVVLGAEGPAKDIRISRISLTQTNFETTPVTVLAEVHCRGFLGRPILIQLLDEAGRELQRTVIKCGDEDKPIAHRFRFRPSAAGISFYRVRAVDEAEEALFEQPEKSSEATLVNNSRLLVVDRGQDRYRVLYVAGRPNWDFKFLRRAIETDDEVDLVGLLRIAKREPKFTFRSREDASNTLYKGFDNRDEEETEQYDQPVLLRLGIDEEGSELRDGFPQAADVLFQYDALVLDDLEAAFFTQDQMSLIQQFVSHRGGGLLMLGGRESFLGGKYDRTPVADLLPIYLDRVSQAPAESFRFDLTREGVLQPWVRLRATEHDERKRLAEMPHFKTVNRVRTLKPGAAVLAHVQSDAGDRHPALVVQRFGKGRVGALLVGDMWRWNLRRPDGQQPELERSWRQTVRWLVADVPRRIEVDARPPADDPAGPLRIAVTVRDEVFQPLDNARVAVQVSPPDSKQIELTAAPSENKAGVYVTSYLPRTAGAYRAQVTVTAADGSEIGQRKAGWVSQPELDEFSALAPNRPLLERLARDSGGEVIEQDRLHQFVTSLPNRKIPVTEPWIYPLWHQWGVFLFAVACLAGEWGLRRWRGLP